MTKLAVGMVLDESGSMAHLQDEVIVGINEYVADMRDDPDSDPESVLTLVMFDYDPSRPLVRPYCQAIPANKFIPLSTSTYRPRGLTPLWDAVGTTIKDLEKWVDDHGKEHTVLFVIQTDGYENASKEWTKERVSELIQYKEGEGWKFIFLGANMTEAEAEQQGALMGMQVGSTMSYAGDDTLSAYTALRGTRSAVQANPKLSSVDTLAETRAEFEKDKKKRKKDKK